eukprot:4891278-Pyramimonas_sp.AAC.1
MAVPPPETGGATGAAPSAPPAGHGTATPDSRTGSDTPGVEAAPPSRSSASAFGALAVVPEEFEDAEDTFLCKKENRMVPVSEKFAGKGVNNVCCDCQGNYKALTRRWKGNKGLKDWWNAKNEDDQIEWYREHKA